MEQGYTQPLNQTSQIRNSGLIKPNQDQNSTSFIHTVENAWMCYKQKNKMEPELANTFLMVQKINCGISAILKI